MADSEHGQRSRSHVGQPIFVDIDGTLTYQKARGGEPHLVRIAQLRRMIDGGAPVVLWSGSGTDYARAFATEHGLAVIAAIGKPHMMVDDNPTVRPTDRMPVVSPEDFFGPTPTVMVSADD